MGEHDLKTGMTLHDAVEDETAGTDGLLERVADGVEKVVVGEPARLGETRGVDQDHHPQLLDHGPEVLESGTRQLLSFDVSRDLDAGKPELPRAAPELFDRGRRVLNGTAPRPRNRSGRVRTNSARSSLMTRNARNPSSPSTQWKVDTGRHSATGRQPS